MLLAWTVPRLGLRIRVPDSGHVTIQSLIFEVFVSTASCAWTCVLSLAFHKLDYWPLSSFCTLSMIYFYFSLPLVNPLSSISQVWCWSDRLIVLLQDVAFLWCCGQRYEFFVTTGSSHWVLYRNFFVFAATFSNIYDSNVDTNVFVNLVSIGDINWSIRLFAVPDRETFDCFCPFRISSFPLPAVLVSTTLPIMIK